jgi:transposase
MGAIVKRTRANNTYYIYQESYRVKLNRDDRGKKRGSGRSKVCTRAVYLGSAEKILDRLTKNTEPLSVTTRQFGVLAAAYQTAVEIGLPRILQERLPGEQSGVPLWIYFFVTILNRLHNSTSKNKMSAWLAQTVLPELLGFDPERLSSKNFWYAADNVLSEKELRNKRETQPSSDDPFAGLCEDTFTNIEAHLFTNIDNFMGLSPETFFYDTTNFYTYIEQPKRSQLANTCHSKQSKHHLRHVGLLMAVERTHGLPLMSRVYRANRHDTRLFSAILAELVMTLKKLCRAESDLVIILDKGNNSQENFKAMAGQISWVGSVVPSHHKDLIDLDLCEYHGVWKDLRYYRCRKNVMGADCALVLTFNGATARKQEHTLTRGLNKLKSEIRNTWASYKKRPTRLTRGITTMLEKSDYGAFLHVCVEQGELHIKEKSQEIEARNKRFGKNLIFSNMLHGETGYLINMYGQKKVIEDDFQLLKDPQIIRFRPIRHWTDTKIRAYASCCVMSMALMRIMTPQLLKDELSDLREVIMVHSPTKAVRKITDRSAVQEKLWAAFKLHEIERQVVLH